MAKRAKDDDTPSLSRQRGRRPGPPMIPIQPPFEQLLTQVKVTNTLLAAQLLQHVSQQDIIGLLKGVGASNQTIADILGTSYATVAVSVGRIRQRRERKHQPEGVTDGAQENAAQANVTEADLRETGEGPERS